MNTPHQQPHQQKKLQILKETAEAYTLNTRSFCEYVGSCTYKPTEKSPKGCAITRLVSLELAATLPDGFIVSDPEVFNLLPDELKELGKSYLQKLQNFHDLKENWCETGLSSYGQKVYENFVNLIEENKL